MGAVLLEYMRAGKVECVQRGDIAVVDAAGKVIYTAGQLDKNMFWRSAAKPFQVLPLIERGGAAQFALTPPEIALMTASHSGEPRHVELLRSLLSKLGFSEADLECGVSRPLSGRAARDLMKQGLPFLAVHNPCSGKHSGMLALAKHLAVPAANYYKPEHPVQQLMLEAVARASALPAAEIETGIDGCGVPVFYLPLNHMALAYARLAQPEQGNWGEAASSVTMIRDAMLSHPEVVSGQGRLDALLNQVTKGRLLAKVGAEAVYCVASIPDGIGIALKIESGSDQAVAPVVLALLRKLELISEAEWSLLTEKFSFLQKNHRGDVIGTIAAVF